VEKRVSTELAKIRSKFAAGKISGYDLKKYVWKLIYIFMMGFDVDFGHIEAVQLLTMPKYSEKNAGHIAVTLMLNENNDVLRLTIQAIKKDLATGTDEVQCLALSTIANIGGEEFAESLSGDVLKLLISNTSRNFVKKKAALALLRLFRKYPDIINPETFPAQLAQVFDDHNLGVVLSISCLVLGIVSHDPEPYVRLYSVVIKQLGRLLTTDVGKGYLYRGTACPWLQVKLLKILQYFPPPEERGMGSKLGEHLATVLTKTEVTKDVNKNNSDYSILFEAINLIIHLNLSGMEVLFNQTLSLLGRFIAVKEPNIRYLGLEAMAKFCAMPEAMPIIRRHLSTIQYSLTQPDISIRRRALDLMFALCDASVAEEVVSQLMSYLTSADFNIKEEMVLKIAILAERFAPDKKWYIDIILKLISTAGDFVSQDIVFRVIQIVSYEEELQEYAASMVFEELKNVQSPEILISVAGYILGEYGHLIDDKGCSTMTQFQLLDRQFPLVDAHTQAMLLSAYMKMANSNSSVKKRVQAIFQNHTAFANSEIQQRAIEYNAMLDFEDQDFVAKVWELMPPFPKKDSVLPKLLRKATSSVADKDVFSDESKAKIKKMKKKVGTGLEDTKEEEYGPDEEDEEEGEEEEDDEEEEEEEEEDESHGLPSQNYELASKLLYSDSGKFYECEFLQIGIKMKSGSSHQLKMIVYFGNLNENSSLEDVSLSLAQPSKRSISCCY